MLGERSEQRSLWEADRLYLDHVGRDTFYGLCRGGFVFQRPGQRESVVRTNSKNADTGGRFERLQVAASKGRWPQPTRAATCPLTP